MASYGSATIQAVPSVTAVTLNSYAVSQGMLLDTAKVFTFGSSSSVTPKRFLNVGGVAVAIQ